MKCFETNTVYCYCKFVENEKCPLIELKKLIAKCKDIHGHLDIKTFNKVISLYLIELMDKIE